MAKRPIPAPRAQLKRQEEVCSDDTFKKPPPVAPKTYKNLKVIGQPLPGMVRSNTAPESNQPSETGAFTVQRNNVEDQIRSLTLQGRSQTLDNSELVAQGKRLAIYENKVVYMEWWHSEQPWKELQSSGPEKIDVKEFTQKAENLNKALFVYHYLMSHQETNMQGQISELEEVADGIDKVFKGVKIAGITGGAAGAVGVAAAVGGVILAPLTMGASLAVTAVGVGVAAAGGVTGASAAITNKVHANMDRKKVEKILKEHATQIGEIERCVKFICTHVESLKKYDLSKLREVDSKLVNLAYKVGDSVGTLGEVSKSSGMIEGLALGLDMYFSQEDSKQLKKGKETKFAKKIRKLAKQMQASLDELMKFKNTVSEILWPN